MVEVEGLPDTVLVVLTPVSSELGLYGRRDVSD